VQSRAHAPHERGKRGLRPDAGAAYEADESTHDNVINCK
jgi:hypothetical protein